MKKKGFTLIELLGVIIVISLIGLIVVPVVTNSIEKARRGAFEDNVYEAFSQIQYYLVENNLTKIPEEGIEVKNITFKNNSFVSGVLKTGENGNIRAINVSDGRYCAIGEKDQLQVYDGACDLTTPSCTLQVKETIGVGGWYGFNPTVQMSTSKVKSGFLTYGIGLTEQYNNTINGLGNIGKAEYKTTGNSSTTVKCYVQNIAGIKGQNEIKVPIDKTAPTEADFTYSVIGKNLTIVASGKDAESNISRYQYSIDNGNSWTDISSSNTYTYENLIPKVYQVKVRVYNGTYVESNKTNNLKLESAMKEVSTIDLAVPTYTKQPEGWTKDKVDVTVHFTRTGAYLIRPSIDVTSSIDAITCSNVLNGKYTCDGEKTKNLQKNVWYQVTSDPTLSFTENGSIIAQTADGYNYLQATSYAISNIDRVKPVVKIDDSKSTKGNNDWYKDGQISIVVESSGVSGVSKQYYCKSTNSTCTPNIEIGKNDVLTIEENQTGIYVCGKLVSATGVDGDIVCGGPFKVDRSKPTATFAVGGVTCQDNYEINPSKAGTTWTLTGTSNVTKTYECEDSAGNVASVSHTYKYNSCKTGSNTCQGGYNQTWSDCATKTQKCTTVQDTSVCLQSTCTATTCTNYSCTLYKSCTLYPITGYCTKNGVRTSTCYSGTASNPNACNSQCQNACVHNSTGASHTCTVGAASTGRQSGCGTETVTGAACANAASKTCISETCTATTCTQYGTKQSCSDVCQGGYVNGTYNSCKTGSNTCQGGFDL